MTEVRKPWLETLHVHNNAGGRFEVCCDEPEESERSPLIAVITQEDHGGRPFSEQSAFADLFAAAPELYRALLPVDGKAILRCPNLLDPTQPDGIGVLLTRSELDAIRAALRKARGES